MKKLVFAFVAMAAMAFATTTTSCNKGAANDSVADTTAQADTTVKADTNAQADTTVKVDTLKK